MQSVAETPIFTRQTEKLFTEGEKRVLIDFLAEQPPDESRRQVMDWIGAMRKSEIHSHAGDPGPLLARRLSNAEYNYTIRDLTGVDLRPAREFPVDPANQPVSITRASHSACRPN